MFVQVVLATNWKRLISLFPLKVIKFNVCEFGADRSCTAAVMFISVSVTVPAAGAPGAWGSGKKKNKKKKNKQQQQQQQAWVHQQEMLQWPAEGTADSPYRQLQQAARQFRQQQWQQPGFHQFRPQFRPPGAAGGQQNQQGQDQQERAAGQQMGWAPQSTGPQGLRPGFR